MVEKLRGIWKGSVQACKGGEPVPRHGDVRGHAKRRGTSPEDPHLELARVALGIARFVLENSSFASKKTRFTSDNARFALENAWSREGLTTVERV